MIQPQLEVHLYVRPRTVCIHVCFLLGIFNQSRNIEKIPKQAEVLHDSKTNRSSGPIDHQLSVTGDEAVSEVSDADEPANAEGEWLLVSGGWMRFKSYLNVLLIIAIFFWYFT